MSALMIATVFHSPPELVALTRLPPFILEVLDLDGTILENGGSHWEVNLGIRDHFYRGGTRETCSAWTIMAPDTLLLHRARKFAPRPDAVVAVAPG